MRIFRTSGVIHIGLLDANNPYCEPLKLSTRQEVDISIAHLVQLYTESEFSIVTMDVCLPRTSIIS